MQNLNFAQLHTFCLDIGENYSIILGQISESVISIDLVTDAVV